MQQPDGRPSSMVAKRSTRTVNFRFRAAVVTTPNGPYFIKLTGPAASVAAADSAFEQFPRA